MENDVMVTAVCTAYNHGKYVRKTLEGFLMQKTTFPFEVVVHDDASTDDTPTIIREYEEKYPDVFKVIYQTVNQYSIKNKPKTTFQTYIAPLVRGKYICFCEGDDYWTDPLKLQKQFDAMESHPECALSVHAVEHMGEDGTPNGRVQRLENVKTGVVKSSDFVMAVVKDFSFQTSSYFFRTKDCVDFVNNMPAFAKKCKCGDDRYMLYFPTLGDAYYFAEPMSRYREFATEGWTAKMARSSVENKVAFLQSFVDAYEEYDKFTSGKFHDACVFGTKRKQFKIALLQKDMKTVFDKEYRSFFNRMTLNNRIKLRIKRVLALFGKK